MKHCYELAAESWCKIRFFAEELVGKYKDCIVPIVDVPLIFNTEQHPSPVAQKSAASSCSYCGEYFPHEDNTRCRGKTHQCSLCSRKGHLETCCFEDLIRRNKELHASGHSQHAHVTEDTCFLSLSEYDLFTFLAIVPLLDDTTSISIDHDTPDSSGDPNISTDNPPFTIPPCFTIVDSTSTTDGFSTLTWRYSPLWTLISVQ